LQRRRPCKPYLFGSYVQPPNVVVRGRGQHHGEAASKKGQRRIRKCLRLTQHSPPNFESIQIDQDKAQQLCSEVKAMVRTSGRCLCNQLGNVPVLKGNASFNCAGIQGTSGFYSYMIRSVVDGIVIFPKGNTLIRIAHIQPTSNSSAG